MSALERLYWESQEGVGLLGGTVVSDIQNSNSLSAMQVSGLTPSRILGAEWVTLWVRLFLHLLTVPANYVLGLARHFPSGSFLNTISKQKREVVARIHIAASYLNLWL